MTEFKLFLDGKMLQGARMYAHVINKVGGNIGLK